MRAKLEEIKISQIKKNVKSDIISKQERVVNYKHLMVLEKAEEPEIKLPTSAGSSKKRVPEKHLFLLY